MNNSASTFYEGMASTKQTAPQIHYLQAFQEKRREYLEDTVKKRREGLLHKSRQFLLQPRQQFSKDDEEPETGDEDFEEDKSPENHRVQEAKMSTEDHLARKFERMDFERPRRDADETDQQQTRPSNKLTEKRRVGFLPKLLSVPEWMIAPPSDLNGENWFVYAKPEGARCFIISTDSETVRRDKNGFLEESFMSQLPSGSPSAEAGKVCILDCVFSTQLQMYFIMDVLIWNGVTMSMNSTESRFFFIETNILGNKDLMELSEENVYKFTTPKKYDCTVKGFVTAYQEHTYYQKEGLVFAHKTAEYLPGSNPHMLAWKDVFTSLYAIETNGNVITNDVQCVLELNEDYELVTLDGEVLAVLDENQLPEKRFKAGNLYRVSIESIGVNEGESDILKAFTFNGVKILKKSSVKRPTPDNISKIIFQYLIRNAPITADNLKAAIESSSQQKMEANDG